MTPDLWTMQPELEGLDLTGFVVEARDGELGKVDAVSDEAGSSYVVVETGFWILGKHSLVPAAAIEVVDVKAKKIFLNRSKEEIEEAPGYDPAAAFSSESLAGFGRYYAPYYR